MHDAPRRHAGEALEHIATSIGLIVFRRCSQRGDRRRWVVLRLAVRKRDIEQPGVLRRSFLDVIVGRPARRLPCRRGPTVAILAADDLCDAQPIVVEHAAAALHLRRMVRFLRSPLHQRRFVGPVGQRQQPSRPRATCEPLDGHEAVDRVERRPQALRRVQIRLIALRARLHLEEHGEEQIRRGGRPLLELPRRRVPLPDQDTAAQQRDASPLQEVSTVNLVTHARAPPSPLTHCRQYEDRSTGTVHLESKNGCS